MTKKERILEILSRKEAATPVKDRLLDAARRTEAFARSREGVSSIAGGIGGGLLGALLSGGSRKKRIRDILIGAGIGGAGGYAAGKYTAPDTSAAKAEYDPVADGANPTITGQTEQRKEAPAMDPKKLSPEALNAYSERPTLKDSLEASKARAQLLLQQRKEAELKARQEAGQRVSTALAEQGRRQARRGGLSEFGAQLVKPGGYEEALGTTGKALANTASNAKASIVGGAGRVGDAIKGTNNALGSFVKGLGNGAVDLGGVISDALRKKRDISAGKTLPPDVQAEYDRLLKRK